ncbi:MAG: hypothetical protein WCI77_08045 [Candidatus Omnitrophota bacterium]
MTTFKEILDNDVKNVFLNTNEFAESITFTPYGGTAKSIKAIVQRSRLDPASEDTGRSLLNQAEIFIANDSVEGVTSINKGQDKVSLPATIGGSSSNWLVVDIIDHDSAIWHLLIQK